MFLYQSNNSQFPSRLIQSQILITLSVTFMGKVWSQPKNNQKWLVTIITHTPLPQYIFQAGHSVDCGVHSWALLRITLDSNGKQYPHFFYQIQGICSYVNVLSLILGRAMNLILWLAQYHLLKMLSFYFNVCFGVLCEKADFCRCVDICLNINFKLMDHHVYFYANIKK